MSKTVRQATKAKTMAWHRIGVVLLSTFLSIVALVPTCLAQQQLLLQPPAPSAVVHGTNEYDGRHSGRGEEERAKFSQTATWMDFDDLLVGNSKEFDDIWWYEDEDGNDDDEHRIGSGGARATGSTVLLNYGAPVASVQGAEAKPPDAAPFICIECPSAAPLTEPLHSDAAFIAPLPFSVFASRHFLALRRRYYDGLHPHAKTGVGGAVGYFSAQLVTGIAVKFVRMTGAVLVLVEVLHCTGFCAERGCLPDEAWTLLGKARDALAMIARRAREALLGLLSPESVRGAVQRDKALATGLAFGAFLGFVL